MVDFDYDQFVVVTEKGWSVFYDGNSQSTGSHQTIRFPLMIGDIEWQMSSSDSGHPNLKRISLTCLSADQVHLEIHGYCRLSNATNYGPGIKYSKTLYGEYGSYEPTPLRHVFKHDDRTIHFTAKIDHFTHIFFTVRVLKDRALFPDFKSPVVNIDSLENNLKLRVGDQMFHVNKELLSAHSKVFDRMFNGDFKEANQTEIELKHEQASPALFEDFLLVLCIQEAIPNRKNLIGLFKLANIYDMCLEMPVEERYMLALELGNEKMKDSIMDAVDLAETKRIIAVHEKERAEMLERMEALIKNQKETE